jgi:thiol-disulfide isomerase/thioredoxin
MTKQMNPAVFVGVLIIATIAIVTLMGQAMPGGGALAGQRFENGPTITDFSGKTADGKTFRLSDYKGKVVLLNFWATWCGPCIEEMPDLIKLQEKYGEKGFVVVGLSADDTFDDAIQFAKEKSVNYPILDKEATGKVSDLVGGVKGLPTSFLLNKEGKIVWGMEGMNPANRPFEVISNEINRLL